MGDYPDRRMFYFVSDEGVRAKKGALVKAVQQ